ncbi:MAG: HPr kinase/phosphatase C-terminal domain-containing protein [Alphaproteobacteria bacterium]|nr:HPr kinase/phosphatase C-terminal domain-containing protein [Alphaproteobacteria bacterium]
MPKEQHEQKLIHASVVEWNNIGILITGRSGKGKSELTLKLLEAGAILVSDDAIFLDKDYNAYTPENIKGLIEIRGIGIVSFDYKDKTQIKLHVILKPYNKIERMPKKSTPFTIEIDPFSSSAVYKIKIATEILLNKRDLIL